MKKVKEKPTKEYFRELVKDFYEKKTDAKFVDLIPFQRSQWMTRFYVSKILRIISPGLVPDDDQDLEDSMTDDAGDGSADFIYRADGRVFIIQAKYIKQGKSDNEGEFNKFREVLTKIYPKSSEFYKINERVRDLASDIEWETDSFELHYITLGKPTGNMIGLESDADIHHPHVNLEDRVELFLFNESQLNEKIREANSTSQKISEPVELLMSQGDNEIPWIKYKNSCGRESYIGIIKASQFRDLWRFKNKLFTLNIRNYVGDTSTNKGIIATAINKPENFFYFNNGISAVATKIEPDINRTVLRCHNFSIVNGAQTVRSLVKAHKQNSVNVKNASVLIRISEENIKINKTEYEFIQELTKYNNTQNSIKIADFRSNDPVQQSLKKHFSEVNRKGKTFKYKNKREIDENLSREISINMEEFTKTIHSFRLGPIDFFGGTSYLFDLKKGYAKVFGDGEKPFDVLTKEDFNVLAGTWFLCEYIKTQIDIIKKQIENKFQDNSKLDSIDLASQISAIKSGLERRWMIYFTVGELLREKYQKNKLDLNFHLAKLAKPNWLDEPNVCPATNLNLYARTACDILIKLYINAKQNPLFKHRNWFRSEDTRKSIQNEINFFSIVIDTLPFIFNIKND